MERQREGLQPAKEQAEGDGIFHARDGLQPASETAVAQPIDPVSQQPMNESPVPPAAQANGNGSHHGPLHPSKRHAAYSPSNSILEPDNGVISVNNCPVCGGHHHRVAYRELSQPIGLFTHFYTCEERNEPVPIAISEHDGKTLEIPQVVVDQLCRAVLAGRWVFMVCPITNLRSEGGASGGNEGGERCDYLVQWTTHNAPKYVLLDIAAKFADDMRREVDPMAGRQIQTQPGPPAEVKSMFKSLIRDRNN